MTAKKKNVVKGLLICALIAVIAVGATLAYLSATTGTKTNKFTSDNKINGTTDESFDNKTAGDYTPGDEINKQPSLSIGSDSEAAYGALAVDYYGDDVAYTENNGSVTVTSGTKMSQAQFSKYATVNGLSDSWKLIAKTANGSELYMYNSVLNPGDKASQLFDSVTVNAGLKTVTSSDLATTTVYTYTEDNGNNVCDTDTEKASKVAVSSNTLTNTTTTTNYVDADGNTLALDKLPTFVIDINGYAVQSKNNNDPAAELIKLANQGKTGNDVYTAVQ